MRVVVLDVDGTLLTSDAVGLSVSWFVGETWFALRYDRASGARPPSGS